MIGLESMPPDWLEDVYWRLTRFEDVWTPKDQRFTYNRDGVGRFEAWLLDQWPDQSSFRESADADFVECASAYIGEVYLRAYGGGWYIDKNPKSVFYGPPSVCLDTLDRTPISPYFMMTALLKRRTGRELVELFDNQAEMVAERQAVERPGWRPLRDPIPGVTNEEDTGAPPSEEQMLWVVQISERLASLRQRVGPETAAKLDLSGSSLAALEPVILTDYADEAAVSAASGSEHYNEYLAYIGEVLLAAAGGHWVLRPGEPTNDNPFVGRPFVRRKNATSDWVSESPATAISALVRDRTPTLTRTLSHYAD